MFKKFLIIFVFALTACSTTSELTSPVIYFSNASEAPISNIRVIWADGNILTLNSLDPGDSRLSFYINSTNDFFGLVRISWTNAKGEGVSRSLYFRKNNLPSINDESNYNYVQIYLEQNDFEVMSSDAADLESKTKRREDLLTSYKNKYLHNEKMNIPSSLIRVEPIKDTSVPRWLEHAY